MTHVEESELYISADRLQQSVSSTHRVGMVRVRVRVRDRLQQSVGMAPRYQRARSQLVRVV